LFALVNCTWKLTENALKHMRIIVIFTEFNSPCQPLYECYYDRYNSTIRGHFGWVFNQSITSNPETEPSESKLWLMTNFLSFSWRLFASVWVSFVTQSGATTSKGQTTSSRVKSSDPSLASINSQINIIPKLEESVKLNYFMVDSINSVIYNPNRPSENWINKSKKLLFQMSSIKGHDWSISISVHLWNLFNMSAEYETNQQHPNNHPQHPATT